MNNYVLLLAWACYQGYGDGYVRALLKKAIAENAPANVIDLHPSGVWVTLEDLQRPDVVAELMNAVGRY